MGATAVSDDSFFSRWSRRKALVRSGQAPEEPLQPVVDEPVSPPSEGASPGAPTQMPTGEALSASAPPGPPAEPEAQAPPPTLEDVARLTTESDFGPFVARHVPSEVRNAAVKKLFADPHFNVMDGLDIYIDDYSQPSPLSAAQMAKMVGAQFLKLVDDPEQVRADRPPTPPDQNQAALATPAEEQQNPPPDPDVPQARPEETHDDHADLQLQPDHAPEPPGPGGGAG